MGTSDLPYFGIFFISLLYQQFDKLFVYLNQLRKTIKVFYMKTFLCVVRETLHVCEIHEK